MKQKIIIVEGVDKIGKTTMCGTLSTHLGVNIYKRPSDEFDFTRLRCGGVALETCNLLSHLRKTGKSIIFDRLHLSEYVYGKINRHYDEMDNICWFNAMEDFMQGLDVTLILVRPTDFDWSSKAHGIDIRPYDDCFVEIFKRSKIAKKVEYRWDAFQEEYPHIRELIEKEELV